MTEEQLYKYGKHLGEVESDEKPVRIFKMALADLVDQPDSDGMSKQEFTALVASIREHGLIKPVVITPCSSSAEPGGKFDFKSHGKFRVVVGHNRCRALQVLGYETVDCVIWDRPGIHCDCSGLKPISPLMDYQRGKSDK